jgi:hypothetical protein
MPTETCPSCGGHRKARCPNGSCINGRCMCGKCSGQGCSWCLHTGTAVCYLCRGSGEIDCSRCHGSGSISTIGMAPAPLHAPTPEFVYRPSGDSSSGGLGRAFSTLAWVCGGLLLLGFLFSQLSRDHHSSHRTVNAGTAHRRTLSPKDQAIAGVQLAYKSHKDATVADFTIRNTNALPVSDLAVTCSYYGPGFTLLDHTTRTILDRVGTNTSKTIRDINVGVVPSRMTSWSCAITDLVINK